MPFSVIQPRAENQTRRFCLPNSVRSALLLLLLTVAPPAVAGNVTLCRWADLMPGRTVPRSWLRRTFGERLGGPLEFLAGHSPFEVPGFFRPPFVSPLELAALTSRNIGSPVMVLHEIAKRHGPVSYTRLPGGGSLLFVSDPKIAGVVLAKTDAGSDYGLLERSSIQVEASKRTLGGNNVFAESGEKWETLRRMLMPFFKKAAVDSPAVYGHIQRSVDARITKLAESVRERPDGRLIDLQAQVDNMLFEVTLGAIFRTEVPPERIDREIRPAFADIMQYLFLDTAVSVFGMNLAKLPAVGPLGRIQRSFNVVDKMCEDILRDHELHPSGQPDLVDRLLEEASMSRAEKRRVMMTLIAASYETTSSTIGWTLHSLARNRAAQRSVADQLRAQIGEQRLSPQNKVTKLDHAIDEAMRLYSPFYIVIRHAKADLVIARGADEKPILVPAGTDIAVDLFSAHRNEEAYGIAGLPAAGYYPERFDPAYRARAGADPKPPQTFPFGVGPHVCIGVNLAMSEARYIVSRMLQTFDMDVPVRKQRTRIQSGIATKSANGLPTVLRLKRGAAFNEAGDTPGAAPVAVNAR